MLYELVTGHTPFVKFPDDDDDSNDAISERILTVKLGQRPALMDREGRRRGLLHVCERTLYRPQPGPPSPGAREQKEPPYNFRPALKSLLKGLLTKKYHKRLGAGPRDAQAIKVRPTAPALARLARSGGLTFTSLTAGTSLFQGH